MRIAVRIALAGLGLLATGMNVRGQTSDTPQTAPQNQQENRNTHEITAVPNRPTFASTAEMVQLGVFEIEYGFEAARGHQNINGLLKWGAVKNLELWFLNNPIDRDAGTAGLGDSGAGFKYKLFPQMKARPTVAILYVATLPTAKPGLGAGAMAHLVQFLVSKDFGKHHFDVNEGVQFVGGGLAGGAGDGETAGVFGGAGLAKRESSICGSISIFSAVRVCLTSVPGLPWSILKAYFRP